jgi:SAM-dependent methyltransferase
VHGVDVSAEMLRQATPLLQGVAGVHLHVGDGMTLQCVRKVQFDFALSYDTLAHLPDRGLLVYLLRQVRHRLKRGGLFVFELPASSYDEADVLRLAERAGLRPQKTERADNELWIRASVA